MAELKCIDAQQATELLAKGNPLLLDSRDARDYRGQHHPDAMHLGDHNLRTLLMKGDKTRPVIIYCYLGNSSKDMAKMFCDFGFSDVYSVDGGFTAWKKLLDGAEEGSAPVPKSVDAQDDLGMTALMRACRDGDAVAVQQLLAAGANPNVTNTDGNAALWLACYSDDVRLITMLLHHDAEINHQNITGATALIYAASAGKTNMVKSLLEAGADAELMTQDDFTALDLAANRSILKMLSHASQHQVAC